MTGTSDHYIESREDLKEYRPDILIHVITPDQESRLQGLKDRLADADEDTADLQQEIEELEARIEELTSFQSGRSFRAASSSDT